MASTVPGGAAKVSETSYFNIFSVLVGVVEDFAELTVAPC